MKKTNKPLAAHLEFKERLEELFSQAPKGFGYMCFYYLTNGEEPCEEGVIGRSNEPFIAHTIVNSMLKSETVSDLIQAASSYVTECRIRENKGNHDKHQKTTV